MTITEELEAEIRHVVDLGMTQAESLPLLRDLARRYNEKLFRVRAAFRILRLRRDQEKADDSKHDGTHAARSPRATPRAP